MALFLLVMPTIGFAQRPLAALLPQTTVFAVEMRQAVEIDRRRPVAEYRNAAANTRHRKRHQQ